MLDTKSYVFSTSLHSQVWMEAALVLVPFLVGFESIQDCSYRGVLTVNLVDFVDGRRVSISRIDKIRNAVMERLPYHVSSACSYHLARATSNP